MIETDVLVLGSGGAGLRSAMAAADAGGRVLLATKGQLGRCGATLTSSADVAVDGRSIRELLGLPGHPQDSMQAYYEDIVAAGKRINRGPLVAALVEEAPVRVRELAEWGLKMSGPNQGPGHRFPRSLKVKGLSLARLLEKEVRRRAIRVLDEVLITHLLKREGRINGAFGVDLQTGELLTIQAGAVIMATGGGQAVYPRRTAPAELTGDGCALALQAGAALADMEMIQWLPCTLIDPPIWQGLQLPWLLGPQSRIDAWLLNCYGERFMSAWDPIRMERATRDVVAIAIAKEIMAGRGTPRGGVYLSWAHLPANLLDNLVRQGKTHVQPDWTYQGFDFREFAERVRRGEAAEVAPACHYFMGGVEIDADCATCVPGLYAAGETSAGAHGANRLSGCGVPEFLVHGVRAGRAAVAFAVRNPPPPVEPLQADGPREEVLRPLGRSSGPRPAEIRERLQALAWERVGLVRDRQGLTAALAELGQLEQAMDQSACGHRGRRYNLEWVTALVNRNVARVIRAIAVSALFREESRGAHYRDDFPGPGEGWEHQSVTVSARPDLQVSGKPLAVQR